MQTSAAASPTLTLALALLGLLLSLNGFCAHGSDANHGLGRSNSTEEGQKKKQPHIIFILTDDQGFNDIGYHNPNIKTPTLDKLAAEGVTLENYYVQPICTPSRSQLLTGRYQIHTGLQHSIIRPSQPNCLPPHMDTLPERLRQAGYTTHMVGKWHLGFYRKACLPTRKGFDSFFGSLTGSVDYYSYSSCDGPGLCGYDLHRDEGVAWGQEGKYSTLLFTQRARRILEEHRPADKPLFLLLSLQAVHTPLQPPKTYIYPYRDMANVARRKFAAMVSTVDEAVRNVTYALRKYGFYKNSVIIYSTDNGAQPFTGGSNWPLRGRKGTYWEGGIRGVAFVHSPLLKRRRRISKDLLHITDWFPTLVNLAGANISQTRGLDGFDVWPTISEGKESPRREILHNIDPLHRPPAQTMKWEVEPGEAPGHTPEVSPFKKPKKKLLRQPPSQKQAFKLKSTRKPTTFSNHADKPKSKLKSQSSSKPKTKTYFQQQSLSQYQPHLKSTPSVLPSVTEKSDLKSLPLVQSHLKSKSRRTVSHKKKKNKKKKKRKKKKVSWSGSSKSSSTKLEVKSKRMISQDQTQSQTGASAPTLQPPSYPAPRPSVEPRYEPEPSSGPQSDSQPSSGSQPDPEPSSGPQPDPQSSSGPQSDPEPSPGPQSDLHPSPGPRSEPQPLWDTSIQAAIRVGDWKLLTGDPGHGDWVPPQVLPSLPGRWWNLERTFSSHFRSKHQNVWLFNITADPFERQDLTHQRPDVVQQLLARLAYYNQTAVPVYFPPDDPRANPSHHSGAWVPWVEEEEEEEEKYQGVYKKNKNMKKKKKKKKCRLCKLRSFFLKLNTGMMSNRI